MPNRNAEGHCPTPEVRVGISEKVGKPCGHSSLPDNCAPSVFSNIEVCQGSNSQLPLTSHTWAVFCSICNSSTISGATSIVLQHHPPAIKLANLQSPKFELGASLPSVYEPFLAPPPTPIPAQLDLSSALVTSCSQSIHNIQVSHVRTHSSLLPLICGHVSAISATPPPSPARLAASSNLCNSSSSSGIVFEPHLLTSKAANFQSPEYEPGASSPPVCGQFSATSAAPFPAPGRLASSATLIASCSSIYPRRCGPPHTALGRQPGSQSCCASGPRCPPGRCGSA
jgi:hypothetical protein